MNTWIRESQPAQWLLTLLRVWLGWEWLSAGLGKVGTAAWTGDQAGAALTGFAKGALAKGSGDHPEVHGWFASFMEGTVMPNAELFSYMVAWGEVLVGVGLILGCLTTLAAFFGALMNLMFLMAGTSSTNPEMLVIAILLMVAGANAGKIGADRFVMPLLQSKFGKNNSRSV